MKNIILIALALLLIVRADGAGDFHKMPVKEVAVFKDGHAFVIHQGKMPVDSAGNVQMDYLPAPILGAFWPFVVQKDVALNAVTAGQRRVELTNTALFLQDLIEANEGAEAVIIEKPNGQIQPTPYKARIIGATKRSSEEMERNAPPNHGDILPQKGNLILLQTEEGVKAIPMEQIQNVTFDKESFATSFRTAEFRNLLTMRLGWPGNKPQKEVEAGLAYVQKGIRWIPSYQVNIDGKGNATVKLQATLINELTDLDDVSCHLVVGVPTFQFKDTLDPMALQQDIARLSGYFNEQNARRTSNVLSNAYQSQVIAYNRETPPEGNLGPEAGDGKQVEDLHIFTIEHVTLRKGERMVVPIWEEKLTYRNVYTLDLPIAPPAEAWHNYNNEQQEELARLLGSPKVMHKIRLKNSSKAPLTTAPALLMQENRVLAQGMMTYTAKGASVDLTVTNAVDVLVKKSEKETQRTPDATKWGGYSYARTDLAGTLALTNFRPEPVELEIIRNAIGNITEAGQDGKIEMINVMEDINFLPKGGWRFPDWWNRVNGVGRITWKTKLEPGKSAEFNYEWHYFWR